MRTFLRRLLIGVAALLVAIPILGAVYQAAMEARDNRRFPPPGRLVDVGGHRLHIFCQGAGSPTVVVEQGVGAQALAWAPLNERMSAITTVCAYDRAGMGYSDPLDHPTTAADAVRSLHTLLERAGITDVLSEGKPNIPFMQERIGTWFELQDELAHLSTNGRHIVATQSAHAIHRTEPDLILNAVRDVVTVARGARH